MQSRAGIEQVRDRLGRRMRALRRARGLSQEELADLAECHRTYVAMLERRQANPSLYVLCRIAEALGVEVEELLIDGGEAPGI